LVFSGLRFTDGFVGVNGGGGLQIKFAVGFDADSLVALGQERDTLRAGQVSITTVPSTKHGISYSPHLLAAMNRR